MSQASPHVSLNGSRLTRFLTDLAVSEVEVSHKQFTQRLGRLFDFSDSITLSAVHSDLKGMAFEPVPVSNDVVKEEFLRVRASLVKSIIKSFVPNAGPTMIKLPKLKVGVPADEAIEKLAVYEPYRRFYAAHQREIDFKVQNLQLQVRDAVSGRSHELAQLATLDAALGDALAAYTRKFFAVIPKLLGKRFDFLLQEHKQALSSQQGDDNPALWTQTGGWLDKFYREMQGLLLAELEVRLQPVLGLVEALNEEGR